MYEFIYTSDENLKNRLLKEGYELIKSNNQVYIFKNVSEDEVINANFELPNYVLSNTITL